MKKIKHISVLCIFLFKYLIPFAQDTNVLEQITAISLTSFIDSLNSFVNEMDANYYLAADDYDRTRILQYVKTDFHLILKHKKDNVWLCACKYDTITKTMNCSDVQRKHAKSSTPLQLILKPKYELHEDTLEIRFTTASYYWGKSSVSKRRCRHYGISDWGIFKYVFSISERKWILANVKIGGI